MSLQKSIRTYWLALPLLLMCVFYLYQSFYLEIHDFGNYYFGSYLFRKGQFSEEIYAPCYFNTLVNDLGFDFLGTYLPFTPMTTLFFYPFTFFTPIVAKMLFSGISIGLFVLSLLRAFQHFKINPIYLLLMPIVFYIPIRNGILFGQFYFILFVLIVESYLLYEKGWKWLSAVLLSLAIGIKVFPFLLLFWLVSRKDFKQLLRLFIVGAAMLVLSFAVNGTAIWLFYFNEVLIPGQEGSMSLDYLINAQSMEVFLKFLFVEDSYLNPNAFLDNYSFYIYGLIVFKALLLAFGFSMPRFINSKPLQFAIWLYISLLISPNGSTYSLLLLAIPFMVLISQKSKQILRLVLTICLVTIVCNIPWDICKDHVFMPLRFPRLFFMLLFFMLLFVWHSKRVKIQAILIPFVLLVGMQLLKSSPQKKHSEIVYGRQSIICDYEFEGGTLYVDEFNHIQGRKKKAVLQIEVEPSEQKVSLRDNQIFLDGQQLTDSKDHKSKVTLVNNKVYYLSDYHQGYKFYNVRSIVIANRND